MLVRNKTPGDLFEYKRIGRFDTEVDCPQPRSVHFPNQPLIEVIHPRFAFVSQLQTTRPNALGDAEATVAIERVKRIANHNVEPVIKIR